jgi:hypothetical protein
MTRQVITADMAADYCTRQTNVNPWSSTGDGGGENPDINITCWTLTVDHYWYFPDTHEFVYRYSSTYTWCEPIET